MKMKVQMYVAWASVMILSMASQNARAEIPFIGPAVSAAIDHAIKSGLIKPDVSGRPEASTAEEPKSYKELITALKTAPAASSLKIADSVTFKPSPVWTGHTGPTPAPSLATSEEVAITRLEVDKMVVTTEFLQKYRNGLNKCVEKRDKSAEAMRAVLDGLVNYLDASVAKKTSKLDERVIIANVQAIRRLLDLKKTSFVELKGELDAGDKELLERVTAMPKAIFGHNLVNSYEEEAVAKDAEAGKALISKCSDPLKKCDWTADEAGKVHIAAVAEVAKTARVALVTRARNPEAPACHAIAPPAPPSVTPTAAPSPTGTLQPPAPEPCPPGSLCVPKPTPTPSVNPTQTVIEVPTGITPPEVSPPFITPVLPNENFVNPFNNNLFDAIQRQFDDQNRQVLDLLRNAQDQAARAAADAQRAIQDANNNQNRDNNGADALKAAIQGKNNDDQQQQQPFPPFQPQAAIVPESGDDGPQFEPIQTPPFAQQPPPPPLPFFLPPPPPPAASSSLGPDRPLFVEEGPRPMWGPQQDPRASAALELMRFNQQVQQQAALAAQQRGAQLPTTTNGSLLGRRPPRRLTPGVVGRPGVPTRYQGAGGVSPTLIRRSATTTRR